MYIGNWEEWNWKVVCFVFCIFFLRETRLLHGTSVDVADVPEDGRRCGGSEKIARIAGSRGGGSSGTKWTAQSAGTTAQSAGTAAILHHKVLFHGRLMTQLLQAQLILSLPFGPSIIKKTYLSINWRCHIVTIDHLSATVLILNYFLTIF